MGICAHSFNARHELDHIPNAADTDKHEDEDDDDVVVGGGGGGRENEVETAAAAAPAVGGRAVRE